MRAQTQAQPDSPPPLQLDQPQYQMLKRCAAARDMSEWNQWRKANPTEEVWLEGADLADAWLEEADLSMAHMRKAGMVGAKLSRAYMNLTDLRMAHLPLAHLEGAGLSGANLTGADLTGAHLEGAYLLSTNLAKAELRESHLKNTTIFGANLSHASFAAAIVDGGTYIWDCAIDKQTEFLGVGLGDARVEPGLRQLLDYNVRRLRWHEWYAQHPRVQWPVRLFWLMSDYGLAAGRIMLCFLIFAAIFAAIYWARPSLLCNLACVGGVPVEPWIVPFRALYFSVVTMTTVGFGDISANPNSWLGHMLLMVQVSLGYLVLGALVTRFSVLFTAGGPTVDMNRHKQLWQDEE